MTKKQAAPRAALQEKAECAPDKPLLFLILALSLFGTLMVFSASTAYADTRFGDAYYFVKRQTLWLTVGIGAMLLCSRVPPVRFWRIALPLYLISLALLALVPIIGSEAGGATRWITLGPLTLQPSEISKTALVLLLSYYFSTPTVEENMAGRGWRAVRYGIVYPILLFLCK